MIIIETIGIYVKTKAATYFDRFGIKYVPKDIKKFIGDKDIIAKIYRMQTCYSMWINLCRNVWFFCLIIEVDRLY